MKVEEIGIVVKLDTGHVHQVILTKEQRDIVLNLLSQFEYPIRVIDKPIETIDIIRNESFPAFNVKKPYMTNEEAEDIF